MLDRLREISLLEILTVIALIPVALLFVITIFNIPIRNRVLNPRPEEPDKLMGQRVTFFYARDEEGEVPRGRVSGRVNGFDGEWYSATLEQALDLVSGGVTQLLFRAGMKGLPL